MRRHVLPKLEDLDLDTRDIAEAMARRAGLSLDEWMAAAIAERLGRQEPRPKPERRKAGENLDRIVSRLTESSGKGTGPERPEDPAAREDASKTAIALESMVNWIEHAEERLTETARMSADQQDRIASVLAEALSAVKARLDSVERHVASERNVPARIEFPVEDAVRALAPLSETLAGLRSNMSRLADRLDQPAGHALPPAIDEIRADIERLRSDIGGLATHDDVAALDRAVRGLAKDMGPERSGKDILTLAHSVAAVHRRVQGLSEELAEEVYRRLGSEIEDLGKKVDGVARSGVDGSVIDFLAGQIVDLRQDLAQRAEPRQIERLSAEVGALSRQIAELRAAQVGRSDFAALKNSLENVCAALSRTVAAQEASTVPEQLESLSRRLDTLAAKAEPRTADLDPVTAQLALLTERMAAISDTRHEQADALTALIERLSSQVQAVADHALPGQEPLLRRFDRIEEELRQVGRQADTSSVELMLRSLDEKLERQHAQPSALDTLERRIAALAEQLADRPSEPFRQAFDEAASHLRKLQDEAATIAERAAKAALKDAQNGTPATDDFDALKQGFVELKALHTRSDKKTQDTLRIVRDALETLISRYPVSAIPAPRPVAAQAQGAAEKASADMPSADRLEAAVRRLHAAALSQVTEASVGSTDTPRAAEPEASRGVVASLPEEADLGNVRASFIAAARRASQTTVPDKPAPAPSAQEPSVANEEADEAPVPETAALTAPSLIERLRRRFDAHRRPLLFGLAFLILAAGTTQILSIAPGAPDPAPEQVADATVNGAMDAGPAGVAAILDAAELFQPTSLTTSLTTGSVAPKRIVVDPATLGELPTQLPADLRKAALSGDAPAVYEIASRAAEGRDLPHDPSLAAYLFEKAAQAGFAPAQERLAMQYEKGVGIPRNTKLAMTWYERAAKGGNVRAMHNLATLLASGVDGKPNYPAALRWYGEAAESGVRDSQFNLGVLHARGIGTNPDLATAYKWFALAGAQGDDEAARKRDEVACHMSAAELAAAKASVSGWQQRFVDPAANAAPAPAGRTAALEQASARKS